MNHGNVNHGLAAVRVRFVVFAQAAASTDPPKRPLDNPAARKYVKASRFVATFYNLKRPVTEVCEPLDELACVAAVCPDKGETPKLPPDLLANQLRPVSVLDVRWMHHDRQDQAQRVDEQVTFSPLHFFARVVPTWPWGFRGFHRLTIQDGSRRRRLASLLLPNITPQLVMDLLPGAVLRQRLK